MSESALPYLTADLPGCGGRIKDRPEDFIVEEIPAYEPTGTGDHLFLWIEKVDMGAEYLHRTIAKKLDIPLGEIGSAGLKDRRAISRQWLSVPASAEAKVAALNDKGIRVLAVRRHANKLRLGHLHGNRFRVRIRGADPSRANETALILERIGRLGMPNFYGPQRFGNDGETRKIGEALLLGRPMPLARSGKPIRGRNPFLRKLALSAVQSSLFNDYLAARLRDGLLRTVLPGDVMAKWPTGGLFTVTEPAVEQGRLDSREIIPAGPIFGRRTFPAADQAARREEAILTAAGITKAVFDGFGKLLQGTRRFCFVYVDELTHAWDAEGLLLTFRLPAGSYATILLAEVMKAVVSDPDSDPEAMV